MALIVALLLLVLALSPSPVATQETSSRKPIKLVPCDAQGTSPSGVHLNGCDGGKPVLEFPLYWATRGGQGTEPVPLQACMVEDSKRCPSDPPARWKSSPKEDWSKLLLQDEIRVEIVRRDGELPAAAIQREVTALAQELRYLELAYRMRATNAQAPLVKATIGSTSSFSLGTAAPLTIGRLESAEGPILIESRLVDQTRDPSAVTVQRLIADMKQPEAWPFNWRLKDVAGSAQSPASPLRILLFLGPLADVAAGKPVPNPRPLFSLVVGIVEPPAPARTPPAPPPPAHRPLFSLTEVNIYYYFLTLLVLLAIVIIWRVPAWRRRHSGGRARLAAGAPRPVASSANEPLERDPVGRISPWPRGRTVESPPPPEPLERVQGPAGTLTPPSREATPYAVAVKTPLPSEAAAPYAGLQPGLEEVRAQLSSPEREPITKYVDDAVEAGLNIVNAEIGALRARVEALEAGWMTRPAVQEVVEAALVEPLQSLEGFRTQLEARGRQRLTRADIDNAITKAFTESGQALRVALDGIRNRLKGFEQQRVTKDDLETAIAAASTQPITALQASLAGLVGRLDDLAPRTVAAAAVSLIQASLTAEVDRLWSEHEATRRKTATIDLVSVRRSEGEAESVAIPQASLALLQAARGIAGLALLLYDVWQNTTKSLAKPEVLSSLRSLVPEKPWQKHGARFWTEHYEKTLSLFREIALYDEPFLATLTSDRAPDVVFRGARQRWPHKLNTVESVAEFVEVWIASRLPTLQTVFEAMPLELDAFGEDRARLGAAMRRVREVLSPAPSPGGGSGIHPLSDALSMHAGVIYHTLGHRYHAIRLYADSLDSYAIGKVMEAGTGAHPFPFPEIVSELGGPTPHGAIVRLLRPVIEARQSDGAFKWDGAFYFLSSPARG